MSLEKMFLYEPDPRLPSENLARNKVIADQVQAGKYNMVARVYTHTPGVILGSQESRADVNEAYCEQQGLEVVNRPTGGSAILVEPDLALCYSVFANTQNLGLTRDITALYKMLTLPIAKKMGPAFSVEGSYYMRRKQGDEHVPFAGHAMRMSRDLWQFDGVVNMKPFDMDRMRDAIRMRELYGVNGSSYIGMNGKFYNLNGQELESVEPADVSKVEAVELAKTQGLSDANMSKQDFVIRFREVIQEVFDGVQETGYLSLDPAAVNAAQQEILANKGGKQAGLGHCFIDWAEPEPRIHTKPQLEVVGGNRG